MEQQLTKSTIACTDSAKLVHLQKLEKLSLDTLALLAELSQKPGVEQKLKKNAIMIKALL